MCAMNQPHSATDRVDKTAYEAALDYLYDFVNYESKMTETYAPEKMDPFRPARLLRHLDDPHRRFPSIHVAGSKGKGSVAAMCAASLRAAGLQVGLYTSPHLQDFRERIRILSAADRDGRITQTAVVDLVEELQGVVPLVPGLTWFELVTALAFMYFAREGVDVAVVEVGLGGRLDATNVLRPLVSVITSLSLEHMALLGNTLAEIAAEKGGIIKQGVPVVAAPQADEALRRLEQIAGERGSPLILVGREWQYADERGDGQVPQRIMITRSADPDFVPAGSALGIALRGKHQQENAVVALAALAESRAKLPELGLEAVQEGLAAVEWPGRLQLLHQGSAHPDLLLDGAHTAASAERLAQALQTLFAYERLWLVIGVTADKDIAGILKPLLPLAEGIFVTQADHPRAASPQTVAEQVTELGFAAEMASDVAAAVTAARAAAGPQDLICVTGSMFVLGDLLNCWDSLKSVLWRPSAPSV
jgi:dihydrofolate synthase/folylpolyglutamate synthase